MERIKRVSDVFTHCNIEIYYTAEFYHLEGRIGGSVDKCYPEEKDLEITCDRIQYTCLGKLNRLEGIGKECVFDEFFNEITAEAIERYGW